MDNPNSLYPKPQELEGPKEFKKYMKNIQGTGWIMFHGFLDIVSCPSKEGGYKKKLPLVIESMALS